MSNSLHEPREAIASAQREFAAVGSLTISNAFGLVGACENAFGALYETAVGSSFPYAQYPRHKPGQWITSAGLSGFYSQRTTQFLARLDSYAIDKARYPSPALQQYTGPSGAGRGKELIDGTIRFMDETARLIQDTDSLQRVRTAVTHVP